MTSLTEPRLASAVRRAAVRATLAPSIHNTQPWRFLLSGTSLEVHADWSRRLRVLDPRGRQLLISCGCAVFNARVALAAAGYDATVERWPDPSQPNLVARLTLLEQPIAAGVSGFIGFVDRIAAHQPPALHRRPGAGRSVVDALTAIARRRRCDAVPDRPRRASAGDRSAEPAGRQSREHRPRLPGRAAGLDERRPQLASTEFRRRQCPTSTAARTTTFRCATSTPTATAALPTETYSSAQQCLLLLGTAQDTPAAWLRAGEALEHILLEITRRGYVASPFTALIEVAATNAALREELELGMYPHVLLASRPRAEHPRVTAPPARRHARRHPGRRRRRQSREPDSLAVAIGRYDPERRRGDRSAG